VLVGTFAEDGPETCSGLAVSRYSVSEQPSAPTATVDALAAAQRGLDRVRRHALVALGLAMPLAA
jgi:hypothetical protein